MTKRQETIVQAFEVLTVFASFVQALHAAYKEETINAEQFALAIGNSIDLLHTTIAGISEKMAEAFAPEILK